ncbi:iron reductase [Desulfitobacterium dichloroeliminans]|uniref:iron reductase n=1 Tax=Desulfitobacterium dichloroeliminans TaxID=233055 RepID=UPI001FA77DEC|nr:iron reductase [Desulfitobacterium dichloroeliminans]
MTKTYQKILFALFLSVVFLLITAVTRSSVKQAGGIACFFIAGILMLAVLKVLFLEFVQDQELSKKGKKIFEFLHMSFGWITFVLVIYHSLYFLSLAFWPENNISPNYYVTGAVALIPMSLVITSGLDKNIMAKSKEVKSVYFNHLMMTIVLAVLIIIHINFQ